MNETIFSDKHYLIHYSFAPCEKQTTEKGGGGGIEMGLIYVRHHDNKKAYISEGVGHWILKLKQGS